MTGVTIEAAILVDSVWAQDSEAAYSWAPYLDTVSAATGAMVGAAEAGEEEAGEEDGAVAVEDRALVAAICRYLSSLRKTILWSG